MKISAFVGAACIAAITAMPAPPVWAQAVGQPDAGGTGDQAGQVSHTDVALRAGVIHSDNVGLTPSDGIAGDIWSAGVGLDIQHYSPRLNLSAKGDVDWLDYPARTFGSGVLGNLNALGNVALVPQTLTWMAQETFGQVLLNPLEAPTPDNRKNVYYFTTGPDLTLHFSDSVALRVGARYSRTDSALTLLDSDRYRGDLALIRALSAHSSVSIEANDELIRYGSAVGAANFDHSEVYAHYEVHGVRTDFGTDLGYTLLKPEEGSRTGGLLARLTLSRRISASSRLHLFAGSQYSDASDALRSGVTQPGFTQLGGSVLGTDDPFRTRSLRARWDFTRSRTTFGIEVERSWEVHQVLTQLDRNSTKASMDFSRRLRPRWTFTAAVSWLQEDYYDSGYSDHALQARVALDWALGRTLDLLLRYDRTRRSATVVSSEYTENRVGLYAVWSPWAAERH